jgi:hypothetical protein
VRLLGALALAVIVSTTACSGGGGNSAKAYCDELNKQRTSSSSATEADVSAALDKLVATAPSEIKKEMEAVRQYNNLVVQAQSADPSRSAEFSASIASADAATGPAFEKLTTFVKDKCGVDLGGASASSSFNTVASQLPN